MKAIGIIPARYASTRFPGKPLAVINGKPMIRRVYEQASKAESLTAVCVATDDDRISEAVKKFGGHVLMTAAGHPSGTDRIHEALTILEGKGDAFDVVVNIQGDEPYIHPGQIDLVVSAFKDPEVHIATLVRQIKSADELFSTTINKVVLDRSGNALYFSRSPIPFMQNQERDTWHEKHNYYKHIGIYAYRLETLKEITRIPPSALEKAESLEQLRWLEHGYRIRALVTTLDSQAVDRPEDLSKFTNMY